MKDFFREDISLGTAMAQVTSYAMRDMFYLPPGTIPPMIVPFDPTASVPLCLVVVSNPQMNEQELYDIAYYGLRRPSTAASCAACWPTSTGIITATISAGCRGAENLPAILAT